MPLVDDVVINESECTGKLSCLIQPATNSLQRCSRLHIDSCLLLSSVLEHSALVARLRARLTRRSS